MQQIAYVCYQNARLKITDSINQKPFNMNNKLYLLILLMLAASAIQAQNIVLEFHANHTCTQVGLDTIWMENLTQGGKMVLYYPENTATFVVTDIGYFDPEHNHLYVSQNYPNPFSKLTYIDLYLATPDAVSLNVYDLKGLTIARYEDTLEEGMHRFSFSAGVEKTYILTVTSGKHIKKRIMLQMGTTGTAASEITYLGASEDDIPKTMPKSSDFNFNPGDNLRFTGFVTDAGGGVDYGVINDAPEASTEYLFDIANTPPEQPSEISGKSNVPMNATELIYAVDAVGTLIYQWSVPDGWEITHGQGSHAITVNAGSEGGEISVKAENNCGLGEASVLFVDVYEADIIYGDGVTDIDGNEYVTVIIGDQEWMAENLRVTRDANGNDITRYCYYSDETNCELYGGLYTWHTVMNGQSSSRSNPSGVQGICPTGWHVPSDAEGTELVNYVVSQGFPNESTDPNGAGNALKSCRQVGSPLGGDCDTSEHPRWNSDGTHSGFDEFGFSALPGGILHTNGSYLFLGTLGYWWSSTENSSPYAWYLIINNINSIVYRYYSHKTGSFSLRCVRDID